MKVTERDMDLEDDDSVPTVQGILREAEDIGIVDVSKFTFVEDEDVVGGNDRFVLMMLKEEVLFFPERPRVDLNTTPAAAIASRRTGPDVCG